MAPLLSGAFLFIPKQIEILDISTKYKDGTPIIGCLFFITKQIEILDISTKYKD